MTKNVALHCTYNYTTGCSEVWKSHCLTILKGKIWQNSGKWTVSYCHSHYTATLIFKRPSWNLSFHGHQSNISQRLTGDKVQRAAPSNLTFNFMSAFTPFRRNYLFLSLIRTKDELRTINSSITPLLQQKLPAYLKKVQ